MGTDHSIIAIIPARKGSKGVPGKNMKLLGGKPLIQYTIESALQSKLLSRIVVSSDCEETIAFTKTWTNVEAPFMRPFELASDTAPTMEVVKHAINFYKSRNTTFDYVCLLQPTSPFRSPKLIDDTIAHLLEFDADSLVTVQKTPDKYNPLWAFKESAGELLRFVPDIPMPSQRQLLPDSFHRDGSIYLLKTAILDQNKLLGGKCIGYHTDEEVDLNINTLEEWTLAELHLKTHSQSQKKPS